MVEQIKSSTLDLVKEEILGNFVGEIGKCGSSYIKKSDVFRNTVDIIKRHIPSSHNPINELSRIMTESGDTISPRTIENHLQVANGVGDIDDLRKIICGTPAERIKGGLLLVSRIYTRGDHKEARSVAQRQASGESPEYSFFGGKHKKYFGEVCQVKVEDIFIPQEISDKYDSISSLRTQKNDFGGERYSVVIRRSNNELIYGMDTVRSKKGAISALVIDCDDKQVAFFNAYFSHLAVRDNGVIDKAIEFNKSIRLYKDRFTTRKKDCDELVFLLGESLPYLGKLFNARQKLPDEVLKELRYFQDLRIDFLDAVANNYTAGMDSSEIGDLVLDNKSSLSGLKKDLGHMVSTATICSSALSCPDADETESLNDILIDDLPEVKDGEVDEILDFPFDELLEDDSHSNHKKVVAEAPVAEIPTNEATKEASKNTNNSTIKDNSPGFFGIPLSLDDKSFMVALFYHLSTKKYPTKDIEDMLFEIKSEIKEPMDPGYLVSAMSLAAKFGIVKGDQLAVIRKTIEMLEEEEEEEEYKDLF